MADQDEAVLDSFLSDNSAPVSSDIPPLLKRPDEQSVEPATPDDEALVDSFGKTSTSDDARQAIADDMAGKTNLDFHTLSDLYKTANTQGPWGKLGSSIKAIGDAAFPAIMKGFGHPIEAAKDVYDFAAPAVATASRAVKDFTGIGESAEERQAALQQSIGSNDVSAASGLTSFAGRVLPAAGNLISGVANLADPADAPNVDAVTHIINRAAEQGITDKDAIVAHLGGDAGGDIAKAAEFGGWSLLPVGAESALSPLIAKGAEAAVEKGTQLAGSAIGAGSKTVKALAPAAIAAYEGSQHGYLAMLGALVAGYSKLDAIPAWLGGGTLARVKHALIEAPFDFVEKAANIAAQAKDGQTVMESWADTVDKEINRKAQQLANLQTEFPDDAAKAMAPDAINGGRLNNPGDSTDLLPKGPAQTMRSLENDILGLNTKRSAIQRYQFVNQILSDTGKFGLRAAGNTAVGATTMAALSGTGAPPGQEAPAAVQGFKTGVALAGPGALLHGNQGVSKIIRDRLIAGADNVLAAHPYAAENADAMSSLPQASQDYANKFSGLSTLNQGKPIMVLKPDDLKQALKTEEGVDVDQAPNGYAGKKVIYVNADTLAAGNVPHEMIHGTGLDSDPNVVGAVRDMMTNHPDAAQGALDRYNKDLAYTAPDAKPLTMDSSPKEVIAALGADILKDIPPEALFGGRSGGQLISKWFSDKFGKKDVGTTSQYGFPVTPEMKSALTDALFDLGKKAEQGPKPKPPVAPAIPSVAAASIPSVPAVAPDVIQTATGAIQAMGYKAKEALEMARSAAAEGLDTPEKIVARALEKKAPGNAIPIGGENGPNKSIPEVSAAEPEDIEAGRKLFAETGLRSIAALQRKLNFGYDRAKRVFDALQNEIPEQKTANSVSKIPVAEPAGGGVAGVVPEAKPPAAIPSVEKGQQADVASEIPPLQATTPEAISELKKNYSEEMIRSGLENYIQSYGPNMRRSPQSDATSLALFAKNVLRNDPRTTEAMSKAAEASFPKQVAHPDYEAIAEKARAQRTAELANTKRKTKDAEIERAGLEAAAQAHAEHLKVMDQSVAAPSMDEPSAAAPDQKPLTGAKWSASTPLSGDNVSGRWQVVDLPTIVTSDHPEFQQDLQPRDRTRRASKEQIEEIARKLTPERLTESPTTDNGAPLVDERNQAITGNGRLAALKVAYGAGTERAGAYKHFILSKAAELGINPDELAGIQSPVLIRRVTDYGALSKPELARLSNESSVLGMSAAEKAAGDAQMLRDNAAVMNSFRPSEEGDVMASSNREFINSFIHGTDDKAELMNSDGTPNVKTLVPRVKNAVLGALLGSENRSLLGDLIDRPGELGVTRAVNGVLQAAPRLITHVGTPYDIGTPLNQALSDLVRIRSEGVKLNDFLDQAMLISDPQRTAESDFLLVQLHDSKSAAKVAEGLTKYAALADNIDLTTDDIFGEKPTPRPELLRLSHERSASEATQENLSFTKPENAPLQTEGATGSAEKGIPGIGEQRFMPAAVKEPATEKKRGDLVTWRTDRFGDSSISGNRLDPNDPFHRLLINKAGLSPEHTDRLLKFSDNMGKLIGLENYAHAAKEGEATGVTRKEEQKASPAQARVEKAGETQNAPLNVIPSFIKFNLPSNRFTLHGFNPDKFFANGQKLFSYPESGALKAYPGGVNDPQIVADFKAARENNDNGWTGDGRKPIEGTPFTQAPQTEGFEPNIIPHDRFQVLNAMMGQEAPKGRTPKSADVQILGQRNAAYLDPESGEFNQVRAKLGPETGLLENTSESLRPENMSGAIRSEPVADAHLLRPSGVKPEQLNALAETKPLRTDFSAGGFMPAKKGIPEVSDEKGDPRTRTPEFKRWFGKSKVVDDQGNPVPLYHGTTHNFNAFDPEKANLENDFGRGIYLTNEPADVRANYAGFGPDLTSRVERRTEHIFNETRDMTPEEIVDHYGTSEEDAKLIAQDNLKYDSPKYKARRDAINRIARKEMSEHEGATMKVYASLKNPLEIGGDNEPYWDIQYPEEDAGYGEGTGKMADFTREIRNVAARYDEADPNPALEDFDYDGGKPSEIIKALKDSTDFGMATDENGDLASSEIIREAIERMGYDGIIDRTVDTKFGSNRRIGQKMQGVNPDTYHVIAFKPEQIKSATGNRGTFDPNNPDITFMPASRDEEPSDVGRRAFAKGIPAVEQRGFKALRLRIPEVQKEEPVGVTETLAELNRRNGRAAELPTPENKGLGQGEFQMMPKGRSEPGPNADSEPWVHRYFELLKKEYPDGGLAPTGKLTDKEETEMDKLHQQAVKEFGSYDAFMKAHGQKSYGSFDEFHQANSNTHPRVRSTAAASRIAPSPHRIPATP